MIFRKDESIYNLDLDDLKNIKKELFNKIELGGYNWSKIGKINGYSLYLCDEIVKEMPFSTKDNNEWKKSDVRKWLNTAFYYDLSIDEKDQIIRNDDGDNIFVLSIDEYKRFKNNISFFTRSDWWLRSQLSLENMACIITISGQLRKDFVKNKYGVRPALLLC